VIWSSWSAHVMIESRATHMMMVMPWSEHHRTITEEWTIVWTIEPVERIHHPENYIHDYCK